MSALSEKHLTDLRAAYKECREMLRLSRIEVEETTAVLKALTANRVDYPRAARVDYTLSGGEKPDFPLAKFVRLTCLPKKGAKSND